MSNYKNKQCNKENTSTACQAIGRSAGAVYSLAAENAGLDSHSDF